MNKLIDLTVEFFDGLLRLPMNRVMDSEEALREFALDTLPDFMPHDTFIEREWTLWNDMQERVIYLLQGPLRLRLLCLRLRDASVFLAAGPFLAELADEEYCNEVLNHSNLPAAMLAPLKLYFGSVPVVDITCAVIGAQAFIRQYYELELDVPVKPVSQILEEKHMLLSPLREDDRLRDIERRFELESMLAQHVKAGNTEAALDVYKKIAEGVQALVRMSDPLRSGKNKLVVLNTLLSVAVQETGVNPFYIDAIFWDFAFKVEQEIDKDALFPIGERMVEAYCDAVRRFARQGLSAPVRKAVDYINIHLSDKLTLEVLAKEAKVSKNHLSSLFAKEMGQPVTAYISRQRVSEMARMLLTTSVPVGEVGAYVGFQDANYAARVFKTERGMTPTQFRASGGNGRQGTG